MATHAPVTGAGALMGVLSLQWSLAAADISCCNLPEPPKLLGPPPEPPWIKSEIKCNGTDEWLYSTQSIHGRSTGSMSVTVTQSVSQTKGNGGSSAGGGGGGSSYTSGSGQTSSTRTATARTVDLGASNSVPYNYTTAPPDAGASQHGGSGSPLSTTHILLLVVGMLLVTAIIVFLITFWYKKRYLKYQVSPVVLSQEANYLENYRMRGQRWHGRRGLKDSHHPSYNTMDKQTLVGPTGISQASISSASVDGGLAPRTRKDDSVDGNSVSSGIGMSQPDLHDSALEEEEEEEPDEIQLYHRPYSGRQAGLPSVEYSSTQPDIVKSTMHGYHGDHNNHPEVTPRHSGGALPILAPLHSYREPKRSRGAQYAASTMEFPDPVPRGRTSSRQRPLSMSRSLTRDDPDNASLGSPHPSPIQKGKRRNKKKRNFLKSRTSYSMEDDDSEILANPYARLPGIESGGRQDSPV